MPMKELYNHFNRKVYSTINWYTDRKVGRTLGETFDEIRIVDEKPNPNRRRKNYPPLRTFEYKDFRYVETLNTSAGSQGNIYHTTTGELVATDTVFYNFHVFAWWFYNRR